MLTNTHDGTILIPTVIAIPWAHFSAKEILTWGGPDTTVIFLLAWARFGWILVAILNAVADNILKSEKYIELRWNIQNVYIVRWINDIKLTLNWLGNTNYDWSLTLNIKCDISTSVTITEQSLKSESFTMAFCEKFYSTYYIVKNHLHFKSTL